MPQLSDTALQFCHLARNHTMTDSEIIRPHVDRLTDKLIDHVYEAAHIARPTPVWFWKHAIALQLAYAFQHQAIGFTRDQTEDILYERIATEFKEPLSELCWAYRFEQINAVLATVYPES